jgi:hypothetical protein
VKTQGVVPALPQLRRRRHRSHPAGPALTATERRESAPLRQSRRRGGSPGLTGTTGEPDYAGRGRTAGEQVAAIERAAHQCTVEALSIGDRRIVVGGEPHVRVCESLGTYCTMTGPIQVSTAVEIRAYPAV